MCDSGPALVLRTRTALCTGAQGEISKASATGNGAAMVLTASTLTDVCKPMVTRFSSEPVFNHLLAKYQINLVVLGHGHGHGVQHV